LQIDALGVLLHKITAAMNHFVLLADFIVLHQRVVVWRAGEEGQVRVRRRFGEAAQLRVVPKLIGQAVILHGRAACAEDQQSRYCTIKAHAQLAHKRRCCL